jgi:hypothetical protein
VALNKAQRDAAARFVYQAARQRDQSLEMNSRPTFKEVTSPYADTAVIDVSYRDRGNMRRVWRVVLDLETNQTSGSDPVLMEDSNMSTRTMVEQVMAGRDPAQTLNEARSKHSRGIRPGSVKTKAEEGELDESSKGVFWFPAQFDNIMRTAGRGVYPNKAKVMAAAATLFAAGSTGVHISPTMGWHYYMFSMPNFRWIELAVSRKGKPGYIQLRMSPDRPLRLDQHFDGLGKRAVAQALAAAEAGTGVRVNEGELAEDPRMDPSGRYRNPLPDSLVRRTGGYAAPRKKDTFLAIRDQLMVLGPDAEAVFSMLVDQGADAREIGSNIRGLRSVLRGATAKVLKDVYDSI